MGQQRLFKVHKVGLFCDQIVHGIEKRRGDDVKVITLTLRAQPFDAKLATAIDDGVGDASVRATLFKLNHPDAKPYLRRADFSLSLGRQKLIVFASPDTDQPSIAFDQAKISGTYARTKKNCDGYAFVLKASFGPCGRQELEYLQDWLLSQRFVDFEEAEPSLAFEEVDDGDQEEGAEADVKAQQPAPMWEETDEPSQATTDAKRAAPSARKPMPRHASRKAAAKAKQKSKKGRR